ncbi:aspartic peptidase A1 [Melampsora americana]|nr:aspartic peptidase A1 [Melampsora americana]
MFSNFIHFRISSTVLFLSVVFVRSEQTEKVKLSIPIVNSLNLYTLNVGIGTPPTPHPLGIATGSANTFAGAFNPDTFQSTPSTTHLQKPFFIPYGYGNVTGTLLSETLTFTANENSLTLPNVTIGNVSKLVGFDGFDGLLGLGLSSESYPRDAENIGELLTPTGIMYDRELLEEVMFGISFMPTRSAPDPNGLITFGGVNPNRFIGDLVWYPCSSYHTWDWKASISYGDATLSESELRGSFDTSYTNSPALPRYLFDKYVVSIPGAVWDDSWLDLNPAGQINEYMLRIPRASVAEMEDLCFLSGDRKWCLVPEAQLVPDGIVPNADPAYRYGYVSPIQTADASQRNSTFVFGMKAMERFYVAFDLANYRIGLAETEWTNCTF